MCFTIYGLAVIQPADVTFVCLGTFEWGTWLVRYMIRLTAIENVFQKTALWFTLKQNLLQMQKEMATEEQRMSSTLVKYS